jgi:uncharacterized integral membrane protein
VKHLSWIITVPLLAIAVIFAVNHRQTVEIDLWPLPIAVAPPFYLIVLGAIFVGFLLGGLVVWWSQGRHRRRERRERVRAQEAEHELEVTRRKLEQADAQLKQREAEAASPPRPRPGPQQPQLAAAGSDRHPALTDARGR